MPPELEKLKDFLEHAILYHEHQLSEVQANEKILVESLESLKLNKSLLFPNEVE